ncbi:outer membrane lipoprotein-sorting protein [Sinimarinibacterium thermocellulolyticum]|uniref:Outer membrane lipoprotein-sorting protein n=1 Tax=Sinimarinibacterium thermocellulolyticum TaxID=3170016 RepID=A0ABV2A863_9GAMM
MDLAMRRLVLIGCGLAALLACAPALARDGLDAVLSCMRANIPRSVLVKEVELTATDRVGGTRVLRGRLYGQREEGLLRTTLKIAAPADLAGAAYLLREKDGGDEMYMYLPALQRVRRISGASTQGALWGTDLSYGDIKQINNAFSGGGGSVDGQGELGGRAVHLLSLEPDPAEASRYTKMKVWVDQKTCVSLRVDFHEGENVRKRWTVDPASLKQAGTHWYAGDSTMHDLIEQTHTRLRVIGVDSDVELASRLFNPQTFYLGS